MSTSPAALSLSLPLPFPLLLSCPPSIHPERSGAPSIAPLRWRECKPQPHRPCFCLCRCPVLLQPTPGRSGPIHRALANGSECKPQPHRLCFCLAVACSPSSNPERSGAPSIAPFRWVGMQTSTPPPLVFAFAVAWFSFHLTPNVRVPHPSRTSMGGNVNLNPIAFVFCLFAVVLFSFNQPRTFGYPIHRALAMGGNVNCNPTAPLFLPWPLSCSPFNQPLDVRVPISSRLIGR